MPVTDKSIKKDAGVGREIVVLSVQSVGNSESDTLFDSFQPGYRFYVEKIEHFAEAVTATASYAVKLGTTAQIGATTPTADTRGTATITASVADRKGTATTEINLHATTDGTGAFTGLKVRVHIRPFPMAGEL